MSNINFESITLERIVAKGNLNKAYKKVINNKGSAGVDGMETCDLLGYIKEHPYEISSSILNGTYRPKTYKASLYSKGQWRTASFRNSNRNRQICTTGGSPCII